MLPAPQAKAFLDSRKLPAITFSDLEQFSAAYQYLGLILTQLKDSYLRITKKDFIEHFGDDPAVNPWSSEEGQALARLLYGEVRSRYIAKAWDKIRTQPYQTGSCRRPFRSTSPCEIQRLNQLRYFRSLYHSGMPELDPLELARYNVYWREESELFLALALQEKEWREPLYQLIKDIFLGEDAIGGCTRTLIKALLLTDERRNWQLVGDLLLAAQQEEGLRQTILESVDETSIGALKYIIQLIIEHNLARFSSVARASMFGLVSAGKGKRYRLYSVF